MSLLRVTPIFALTALILAMVPGQGVAMALRQTFAGGARAAMASVAGTSTGLIVWGVASAIGLSRVFAHSVLAYDVLKYAGVAYLGYLSVSTLWGLRTGVGSFDTSGAATRGGGRAFRLGLVTNLTNAKAAVFAVAFIPQFVPRATSLATGIVVLAFVQSVVSFAWYSTLVATVDRAATLFARDGIRRALTAVSALGLLILAVVLLLSAPR